MKLNCLTTASVLAATAAALTTVTQDFTQTAIAVRYTKNGSSSSGVSTTATGSATSSATSSEQVSSAATTTGSKPASLTSSTPVSVTDGASSYSQIASSSGQVLSQSSEVVASTDDSLSQSITIITAGVSSYFYSSPEVESSSTAAETNPVVTSSTTRQPVFSSSPSSSFKYYNTTISSYNSNGGSLETENEASATIAFVSEFVTNDFSGSLSSSGSTVTLAPTSLAAQSAKTLASFEVSSSFSAVGPIVTADLFSVSSVDPTSSTNIAPTMRATSTYLAETFPVSSSASSAVTSTSSTSTSTPSTSSSTSSTSSSITSSPSSSTPAQASSSSSTSSSTTLAPAIASAVLNEHNAKRSLHVDTPDLVWDDDLSAWAYNYVNSLRGTKYDPCSGVLLHSSSKARGNKGENIALATNASPAKLVDLWYNQVQYYDWNDVTGISHNGHDVGHFTQVVWASSSTVGCAVVQCSRAQGDKYDATYMLCDYAPAGNVYNGNAGADLYSYFRKNVLKLKSST